MPPKQNTAASVMVDDLARARNIVEAADRKRILAKKINFLYLALDLYNRAVGSVVLARETLEQHDFGSHEPEESFYRTTEELRNMSVAINSKRTSLEGRIKDLEGEKSTANTSPRRDYL